LPANERNAPIIYNGAMLFPTYFKYIAKSEEPKLRSPVITIGIYVLFSLTKGNSFNGPCIT